MGCAWSYSFEEFCLQSVRVLMSAGVYFFCSLLFASPFLAIVAILMHCQLRRSVWKRKKRKGKRVLGFCPPSAALGTTLLFLSVFYRPHLDFAIEASLHEDVEEDDQGDPETPEGLLSRQLRRIRRGEKVERLVWRMSACFPPFPQKETERMGHGASEPMNLWSWDVAQWK
jgi:hypothetical protein